MLDINIGELMVNRAIISPNVEGYVGRNRYTFEQMNKRVNQFANYLSDRGIKSGDRIALLCKNHEDFITAFFASAKLGIITVPINWRLQTKEIEYILMNSEPSLFIYDTEFMDVAKYIKKIHAVPIQKVGDTAFDKLLEEFSTKEPRLQTKNDDPILIMYTSGTTGKPKGAMLTHTNLFAASIGMSHIVDWWFGDRFLSVAPFFHIGGFAPIITNVHNGCTSILMKDFDPLVAWGIIEKEKVTTMMSVPAMLQFMLKTLDKNRTNYSSLRNITCGASPVPENLIRIYESLGISIQQVYGITEYSGAVTFWKKEMDETKTNSMGKAVFHGKIAIIDPETRELLPPNQVGEIICSGPQVFKGYWRNLESTSKVFHNGWYLSGDLGIIDQDGYLYVIDRLKDMIISGGENIYSQELETVINDHPDVIEVAVVGEVDLKWGEIPKAYVVKKPGCDLTEEDIYQLCRKNLASYKCVKKVEFIEQLPRNAVGKILKTVLKGK